MVVLRTAATLTAAAIALGMVLSTPATAGHQASPSGKQARHVAFDRWRGPSLHDGRFAGARVRHGAVVVGPGAIGTGYDDPFDHAGPRAYDRGSWTTP